MWQDSNLWCLIRNRLWVYCFRPLNHTCLYHPNYKSFNFSWSPTFDSLCFLVYLVNYCLLVLVRVVVYRVKPKEYLKENRWKNTPMLMPLLVSLWLYRSPCVLRKGKKMQRPRSVPLCCYFIDRPYASLPLPLTPCTYARALCPLPSVQGAWA